MPSFPTARGDESPRRTPPEALERECDYYNAADAQYMRFRRFRAAGLQYAKAVASARQLPAGGLRLPAALNNQASAIREKGRFTDSRPLLMKALKLWRTCATEMCRISEAITSKNLALVYIQTHKLSKAEALLRQGVLLLGSDPEHYIFLTDALTVLAWVEIYRNRPARASE
jgi:hypothetical protein